MQTEKQVYSVLDVSQKLGISKNLAYRLCREKKLPGVIHLGNWRMVVSKAALDNLLTNGDNGHQ